ncbi:MAG: 3-isopropylmalate dehydratase large subunit [Candidatus Omnitrophota bacterium]
MSKTAKTIAEKIFSKHSSQDCCAGDFVLANVDFCFGQDGTSSIIIDRFKQLGREEVFDKEKFCMVIDHNSPAPNLGVSAVHSRMRAFAKEKNVTLFEIGCGVCHQIIPEQGKILPGNLVIGADSHTCTYGALGAFATGVGSTDLAVTLASGLNWFKVPETIKITLKGKIPKGVFAKDVILYITGLLGANGATYKALEFYGLPLAKIDMDGRFTIANMAVEVGAKCGFLPVDKVTNKWLKGRTRQRLEPQTADKDAHYVDEKEIDLLGLTPIVSTPHSPDNAKSVEEVEGEQIQEGYLGTCTNGRLSDLKIAAKILKGKSVAKGVKFIIAPASSSIYLEALKLGLIETFIKAGAVVVAAGCGPCVGTHNGVPADGENVISTANRNFKGRMGNPNANIYLASPATVAASVIEGKITDPRKFLK